MRHDGHRDHPVEYGPLGPDGERRSSWDPQYGEDRTVGIPPDAHLDKLVSQAA